MDTHFDYIIVGSGPSGVSAAFPLVEAGFSVLMVDGGRKSDRDLPVEEFLKWRSTNSNQDKWMVGKDFYSLKMRNAVSPKLRVPSLAYVFDDFKERNGIVEDNYIGIGSLATGGLSNAWGCGVAKYSESEFTSFPFDHSDMEASYNSITERIGVSGANDDDMSEYFGLDLNLQDPIVIDQIHSYIDKKYVKSKIKINNLGFKMGRSRVAALSKDKLERRACNQSGNCLWGCDREALYSATNDLKALLKYKNFSFKPGFLVDRISANESYRRIQGTFIQQDHAAEFSANKLLLAAGTLATTRLVFEALNFKNVKEMYSCPTAAFLIWLPKFLGVERKSSFGLGQLSFSLKLDDSSVAFGSTFATTGIPTSEFVRHLPLKTSIGISVMQNLMSSCIVGNLFLSGNYGGANVKLDEHNQLIISPRINSETPKLMKMAEKKLTLVYRSLGSILIPGSFTTGLPGGDIHYAGTLPMKSMPVIGETDSFGRVVGLNGIYVVDGASLPILSEKSHTLTIMANADRIAKSLARQR